MARRSSMAFLLGLGLVVIGIYMPGSTQAAARNTARSGLNQDILKANDFSLWSPARLRAYKESSARQKSAPVAILKIPKLHLAAPVRDGLDDSTLDAGVGLIPGTTQPGHTGNIGIAGHRDGFFRALKDIAKGDTIELLIGQQTNTYVVTKAYVAEPDEWQVLLPGAKPELTLVTCFPFYGRGHQQHRWVVEALQQ